MPRPLLPSRKGIKRGTTPPVRHTVVCKDGGRKTIEHYTRATAIAIYCTACLGYETKPVECPDKSCPLYPFRRPSRKALRGTHEPSPK